ncbi:glycosyltransferase [Polaribacter sp. Hel_I_88]|uniref:glycosyltransferase n=1 Tax=Polaribacter sp. Hel_I_88 TaxID=1250006 RepID=UPI00047DC541|nr:glycosyltransferase [Polaribacter sp. Hel_I_88]
MKKIVVLLPYANPHVLGWIKELFNVNVELKIYCIRSVKHYRTGYFSKVDEYEYVYYLFKNKNLYSQFLKDLKNTNIYVTLGIFEKVFLRSLLKFDGKLYILSEPFNPISSKKNVLFRKLISFYIRVTIKNINFLCIGGKDVKKYYYSLGFKKSQYYNFGYFPKNKALKIVTNSSTIKFIFVGQLIKRKGVSVLINALNYLNSIYKNDSWTFTIIGNGNLKEYLLGELKMINNKNIIFKGLINDNSKLEEYYSDSDILFVPSVFDGWGAVVNEALSKNLAILSSDMVYSSRSLVKQGVNGFVFNNNNLKEMTNYIDYFFINKHKVLDFKKSSGIIYKEWNPNNAAQSFLKLIEVRKNDNNERLLMRL